MSSRPEHSAWEEHWHSTSGPGSLFGRIASFVRKQLLSRAVRHYTDLYFESRGIFVECGCGTAQSSSRIARRDRRLVALDFSAAALRQARAVPVFRSFLQGDIRRLPFADDSVAGIWNLGVMEHFNPAAAREILTEFRRVLKPGGTAILFWPPEFGSSRWVLAPIEWLKSRKNGRPFRFFPGEVNRLRSKRHAAELIGAAGLMPAAIEFTPRDFFIHMVVVGKKPSA